MNILELNNVRKVYKTKNVETVALKNVNFSVEKNEFIAIMGESGSGKTTLLNVISTLDKQTNGKVVFHEIYKGNSNNNEFMERINESLTVLNNRGVDNEF